LAVLVAVGAMGACLWCAAGLRQDDATGEVADRYTTTGRGVRLVDILTGQFESERRWSSDMVFVSVLALGIGTIRYLCGWGPFR
jgi:hypothetical protein